MVTAESVKAKLQGLIGLANNTTGKTDTDLTAAVNALIAGFGQGSSDGGVLLVDETVTLANNMTNAYTSIYQSEKLKNLSWYFVLLVRLSPSLANGQYETVQVSQNKNYSGQMIRWTGSAYSGNHYADVIEIDASGSVKVKTSNASTLPILSGSYRLVVIV